MSAPPATDPAALAARAADDLTSAFGSGHEVAVVMGSGWAPAADAFGTVEGRGGPRRAVGGEDGDAVEVDALHLDTVDRLPSGLQRTRPQRDTWGTCAPSPARTLG